MPGEQPMMTVPCLYLASRNASGVHITVPYYYTHTHMYYRRRVLIDSKVVLALHHEHNPPLLLPHDLRCFPLDPELC